MYYESEEKSGVIGCPCTLLNPYNEFSEGEVVGEYDREVIVRLNNGKEVVENRDKVLIYE